MTTAEVRLWGRTIAAVTVSERGGVASFEYESGFLRSGIEVSPLQMPLSRRIYRFPELPREAFRGLPGLLADALPDKFGNAVIDAWLATQGRLPADLDPVERLCYTGSRGMGALEFRPTKGPSGRGSVSLDVDALASLASQILSNRSRLRATFAGPERGESVREILRVGASAGGARAKAVIAWNPETHEVRSGQVEAPPGFEYWLLKFDGVSDNRDKEFADSKGFGAIEFAYSQMAAAAGIQMSPCRLLEEGERRHFMTRRFDRTARGGKRHMQSLTGLAHLDFNSPLTSSYEQAFVVIRRLGLSMDAIEEQFRRMAFNVVARNQDDHVKNIAFLMDRAGRWTLSPAFDVTYAYNPDGLWTSQHQMSLNGRRDGFTREDFRVVGKTVSMKRGRADQILDEVRVAVRRWPEFAAAAVVEEEAAAAIGATHRLDIA